MHVACAYNDAPAGPETAQKNLRRRADTGSGAKGQTSLQRSMSEDEACNEGSRCGEGRRRLKPVLAQADPCQAEIATSDSCSACMILWQEYSIRVPAKRHCQSATTGPVVLPAAPQFSFTMRRRCCRSSMSVSGRPMQLFAGFETRWMYNAIDKKAMNVQTALSTGRSGVVGTCVIVLNCFLCSNSRDKLRTANDFWNRFSL